MPSSNTSRVNGGTPSWFKMIVAGGYLTLFAISYIYDMISTEYVIDGRVYGVMVIIVGSIFGGEAVKGMRK